MKFKLKLNIGTEDQKRLGLTKAKDGDVVDVDEKVAQVLIGNAWGVELKDQQQQKPQPPKQ